MSNLPQLIGASAAIRTIEEDIRYASRSDAKVLITGESGVGKEVVARHIHHHSRRSHGPLVAINCAGIPDTLLASELFGHVRGSFTDAYADKRGWLEQADGGTIFMDEVGEMSTQMQAMLLRFLESGEIQRVGSERRHTTVDVRVITATNRNLMERVVAKEFRDDLYYRLNVIHFHVPPLRDRREDIPLLLDQFLQESSARLGVERPHIADEALARLMDWGWPGNVRELKNVAERLVVRGRGGVIGTPDLPREIVGGPSTRPGASIDAIAAPTPRPDLLFERIVTQGESFWTAVRDPLMARDITRDDVRRVVRRGLELTGGSYKTLVQLFNMPNDDYKRFLSFLRKYQSHVPIHDLRAVRTRLPQPDFDVKRAVGN